MKAMLGLHPELTFFCGSPTAEVAKTGLANISNPSSKVAMTLPIVCNPLVVRCSVGLGENDRDDESWWFNKWVGPSPPGYMIYQQSAPSWG